MNDLSGYPDDIRQYDNDPRSPFYSDKREKPLEKIVEDLTYSLRSDRNMHGYTRNDVNEWMDSEVHMDTINDIRWVLYINPFILENCGQRDLQKKLTEQIDDRIKMLATEILESKLSMELERE